MKPQNHTVIIKWFGQILEAEIVAECDTHFVLEATLVPGKRPLRFDVPKDSKQIVRIP